MKLDLTIDVDWIDDEMDLDDTVKQSIINSIVNKIKEKIEKEIENSVNKTINEIIFNKINEMTENLFNDFMNKEVIISDKYGDILKSYPNVKAVIKKQFDDFMTQTVDEDGKISRSNYGTKHVRLVYIIDEQLKNFADKFTTDAVKKVSEEIKLHVKDGLTNKLGSELMKVLKVDKMIGLTK